MSVAINYPYTINADGKLISSSDSAKIYLDRVLTLLSTNTTQRPMMQDYGTDLSHALFENDNDIFKAVDQAVRVSIKKWLPMIEVQDVVVGLPNEEGISNVEIQLMLPNNVATTLAITTATFYADGTIKR